MAPTAAPLSFAATRTQILRLPAWTEDQQLSRNSGLHCQVETAEGSSLVAQQWPPACWVVRLFSKPVATVEPPSAYVRILFIIYIHSKGSATLQQSALRPSKLRKISTPAVIAREAESER